MISSDGPKVLQSGTAREPNKVYFNPYSTHRLDLVTNKSVVFSKLCVYVEI